MVCKADLELPKYGLVTFTWSTDLHNAVHNAVVPEEPAFHTEAITPGKETLQQELLDKHYLRKHSKTAHYGQS